MEALYRRHIRSAVRRSGFIVQHVKIWLTKASGFDKKWVVASLIVVGLSLAGLFVMAQYKTALMDYIESQGFHVRYAPGMVDFSVGEVAWFVGFLAVSLWVMLAVLSGAWSGPQAKWAWIFLGAIMVLDLGRSDIPWISYFNYQEKYAPNPVTDFLEQNPFEHRVVGRLSPLGPYNISGNNFSLLYHFWLQNDFPYHNIQSLDVAQWPRMPQSDSNYLGNFLCKGTELLTSDLRPAVRLFQLTNTRYILANAAAAPLLNDRGDPVQRGFQIRARLAVHTKPDISSVEDYGDRTVDTSDDGPFALIEYTRALPRAKLYADWKSPGDGPATLKALAAEDFDPWRTVLVAAETPVAQAPSEPGSDPGTVTITDYKPKHVTLQADARTPAVLLLNDRAAPDWKLSLDGKPAPILRCNYLMRGVFLTPGRHTVDFRFKPKLTALYVSLGAWFAGICIAAYVFYSNRSSMKRASMPAGTA